MGRLMKKPGSSNSMVLKWVGRTIAGLICLAVLCVLLLIAIIAIMDRTNGSMISSGVERKYLLYVPESYDPAVSTPLVVSIHGFASWPQNQMETSRWNDLADREGFIVVYPSGTELPKRWHMPVNAMGITGSEEDVIFLTELINSLEQQFNIDPQRIYINGLSNGAGMTVVMGCRLSERVAAIGGVAGAYLFPLESCSQSRPVPMIAFHGTVDPIVPYTGGPSNFFDTPFPDVPEWIEQRAMLNGCDDTPVTILESDTVTGIEYPDCDSNAPVVFYNIRGGGHTWPGGNPLPKWIAGHTDNTISATELMWEFFKQHPLPPE